MDGGWCAENVWKRELPKGRRCWKRVKFALELGSWMQHLASGCSPAKHHSKVCGCHLKAAKSYQTFDLLFVFRLPSLSAPLRLLWEEFASLGYWIFCQILLFSRLWRQKQQRNILQKGVKFGLSIKWFIRVLAFSKIPLPLAWLTLDR